MANPTGVAPICNAPPDQPTFTTKPPVFPRFVQPTADNPQSIIQAVMALQLALQSLANQIPPNNTVNGFPVGSTSGGGGSGGGGNRPKNPSEPDQWRESDRQTQNVKVVNPDDDSQFVIVKEIVSITFERDSTGEQIVIKRDPT